MLTLSIEYVLGTYSRQIAIATLAMGVEKSGLILSGSPQMCHVYAFYSGVPVDTSRPMV